MIFSALLAFIPISLTLKYLFGASALVIFATSAIAVAALAEWVRRATDHIAARVGPAIGGLLTISFGSIAELVLALFVLIRGQASVVQAQIAGSIVATSLFGLGLAIIVGGATRDKQRFKPERAGLLSSLLILVVIALLLPAVFDLAGRVSGQTERLAVTDEEVSLGVSVVLLVLYFANLIYTLVTHRDVFSAEKPEGGGGWSTAVSLAVLIAATGAIAVESELISSALEEAAGTLHLPTMFLGVIVLARSGRQVISSLRLGLPPKTEWDCTPDLHRIRDLSCACYRARSRHRLMVLGQPMSLVSRTPYICSQLRALPSLSIPSHEMARRRGSKACLLVSTGCSPWLFSSPAEKRQF